MEEKKDRGRAINRLHSMHPLRAKIDKSYQKRQRGGQGRKGRRLVDGQLVRGRPDF